MGGQEVLFPALLPREYYEATGRWTEYGDTLFRLKDRKGADYLLGPTHEEMFTDMVKGEYSSYKDYPVDALPDPDEIPRRGAAPGGHPARSRVPDEGLLLLRPRRRGAQALLRAAPRDLHQDLRPARHRLQDRVRHVRRDGRLGLGGVPGPPPRPARTPSWPAAHCGYAANAEAVTTPAPGPRPSTDRPPQRVLDTPGTPTIESLVSYVNEHHGLSSPPPTR